MLSDGDDTSSLVAYDEVLDLAKRSETAIYAIGLAERRRPPRFQGSGVRPQAAVAGNRRTRVLSEQRVRAAEDLRAHRPGAEQPVRHRLRLEEHGPQRRVAEAVGQGQPTGPDLASRQGYPPNATRRDVAPDAPAALILYACAAARIWRISPDAIAASAGWRRAPRRRGPVPYVHHRHADGPGRPRSARGHDRGRVGVRLAARAGLPVCGADHGRARHGGAGDGAPALLYVIPALDPGVSPRPAVLQSPLFTIHVLAMLFAHTRALRWRVCSG